MSKFYEFSNSIHSHNTRNELLYRYPNYTSKLGLSFIRKTGIDIWRKITRIIGDKHISISLVKRTIMEYSLEAYKT